MLADIGLGIFVALIAHAAGVKLSAALVALSVLFALLPDADFVVHAAAHRKIGGKYAHVHRDLFHYPWLYLAFGGFIAAWFGPEWYGVFMAASLAHFVHDSMGIGWGIKWAYPFSDRIYKLFSTKAGDLSMTSNASWTDAELARVADEKGNEHWVRDIYFRWHPIGIIENGLFLVAVIALWYVMK